MFIDEKMNLIKKELEEAIDELFKRYENQIDGIKKKYVAKCNEYEALQKLYFKAVDDKEELAHEVEELNELIKKIHEDVKDNYRPISIAMQVGISDSDFI